MAVIEVEVTDAVTVTDDVSTWSAEPVTVTPWWRTVDAKP